MPKTSKVSRRQLEKAFAEQHEHLQLLTLLISAIAWRDGGIVVRDEDMRTLPEGEFYTEPRPDGSMALIFKRLEHVDAPDTGK